MGEGVLSFVVELQQELFGREEGNSAELVEVLLVVCHYHITASGQGALVLQHVLEVLNLSQQTCVQLIGITGKYVYRPTALTRSFSWNFPRSMKAQMFVSSMYRCCFMAQ